MVYDLAWLERLGCVGLGDGPIKTFKQRNTMFIFVLREVTGENVHDGMEGEKD